MILGVFGVEVGRVVVVEVHRDDDPVEEADARHGAIMSALADGERPNLFALILVDSLSRMRPDLCSNFDLGGQHVEQHH